MRKITLLLSLLITSVSFSQVIFSEDFDAGLTTPPGWTNNDLAANGEIWTFETGGYAPFFGDGNTTLYNNGLSGNYPIFNSDAYGNTGTAENAALESPVFDCTGYTSIILSFDNFFVSGYGGEGHIEVYDGTEWLSIYTFSEVNVPADDYTSGTETFDVSSELANVSNAQVRFRWVGNWSYYWAFDNVSIFECTESTPASPFSPLPTNGATDIAIEYGGTNTVGPFEWDLFGVGGTVDYYVWNFGTTPTGDDIGAVPGVDSGVSINYSWEASTTYYWYVEAVNCAGTATSSVWSFTTAACLETAAPSAVASAPVPADAATDVVLDYNGNALAFSWTDSANPDETLVLNIGINNPPTQSFNNFVSGETLTGLQINTTYYWSVDVVNCFGTSEGPVWSFTTGSTLSTEDNELTANEIKLYPNPATDVLNIKTSMDFETVEIFNLLGQSVIRLNKDQIINDSVNISNLNKGLYLVKVSAGDNTQTFNVVKK